MNYQNLPGYTLGRNIHVVNAVGNADLALLGTDLPPYSKLIAGLQQLAQVIMEGRQQLLLHRMSSGDLRAHVARRKAFATMLGVECWEKEFEALLAAYSGVQP